MSPIRPRALALALAASLLLVAGCATPGAKPPIPPTPPVPPARPAAPPSKAPAPAPVTKPSAEAKAPEAKTPPKDEAPWARSPIHDWKTPPTPGPAPSFTPPKPETFTLDNGVKVVLVEKHTLPLVSMTLVVEGAGSAADPKGQAGLAAYTADLLDEGADGFSALSLAKILERQGATLHTGVQAGFAFVRMRTLSKTLQLSMDLFGKVVTEPSFHLKDTQRVHKERMVGLKQRKDRPRAVASLVLAQALYGRGTPYGHPADGYAATLAKLGSAQAVRFYRQHWRPEDMTLVVAGDVTRAVLEHDLHITIGSWHFRGRGVKPAFAEGKPAPLGPRLILVDRPGAPQSEVRAGLVTVPWSDPRVPTFDVLNGVLGSGFTSRLNHQLREVLGYTYGAGSYAAWRRGRSPFVVASAIFTPHTVDAVRRILDLVGGMARTPVPAAELGKAKENIIRGLPANFEQLDSMVGTFAGLVSAGMPLSYYQTYDARVREVTAAQVAALAGTLIPEKRLVFVVVGDLAKVRPGLEKLLGPALVLGPDGLPVKAPAPKAPATAAAK